MSRVKKVLIVGALCAVVAVAVLAVSRGAQALSGSVWSDTTTPSVASDADTKSVELGMKFRSSVAGEVTGVRFYKGKSNTGTHTGALWSATGVKLAAVTFTGETATGWQKALFATPITINPNTTYVVSYHAPKGRYAADESFFANKSVTNGPITALQEGIDGSNGVYKYSTTASFPTDSYKSTNYWVDVVFNYTPAPVDTAAPTVTSVTPAAGSTSVSATDGVAATFNEALAPASTSTGIELQTSAGQQVPGTVTYDDASRTLKLQPTNSLAPGVYTATVKTTVKDVAGNALAAPYTWSFTVPAPQVSGVASGPILIVTATGNPFSQYYAEILRTEGLNSIVSMDIAALTPAALAEHSVIVLSDTPVTDAQVAMLNDWVTAGGNLIAMHPDKKLATLAGISDQATAQADKYLKIDTSAAPGSGLTDQTIQYHGNADAYGLLSGTRAVATLYSSDTAATTWPAVTLRSVGTNGGQVSVFTYDLARSVAYTHQGNPAWAGQDRDGNAPIRPNDLFYGAKTGDIQPDYVNLNKVAIPQADEQQRLLTNVIEHMNQDRNPLPKFWYFPHGKKAVMVMAGDDHATQNGTQSFFDTLLAQSPAGCSLANWECYRATSWMYTNGPMTDPQAGQYQAQGFDLGVHVNTGCADWTVASLDQAFSTDLAAFRAKYPSLAPQTGSRTHCIAWSDYVSTPVTELKYGIRMDLNYYYWPGSWVQNRPGYMTGSGMIMRFTDQSGQPIDVYQAPSHLVNESGQTFPAAINLQLDRALGPEGYYGALGTHYDYSDGFGQQLVDAAVAHNIPIVSVQQMLDWTDARNASTLGAPQWNNNVLSFTATVDSRTGTMLRGMLPVMSAKGLLTGLSKAGAQVPYTTEVIKGIQYAFFTASTGTYEATYAPDNVAPSVTATTPSNNAIDVDTRADISATVSEVLDAASVSPATVEVRADGGVLVPATVRYDAATSKVVINPDDSLASNTAYTATLTTGIKDVSGNPLAAAYVWHFTTGQTRESLWAPNAQTVSTATSDTSRVELGVRFSATAAGKIAGISYYKSANDASSHAVTLWDSTGAAIATASTTNETASGWQTVLFATPVDIAANVQYTASYTAPTGQYSYTSASLANGFTNGVLQVPASGGVYNYGQGVPTSSFNATNYWVDVIYTR